MLCMWCLLHGSAEYGQCCGACSLMFGIDCGGVSIVFVCWWCFVCGCWDVCVVVFFVFWQKAAYVIGVRLLGSEMCIRDRCVCDARC